MQVSPAQVGKAQVNPAQVGREQVAPAQILAGYNKIAQIEPAQMGVIACTDQG